MKTLTESTFATVSGGDVATGWAPEWVLNNWKGPNQPFAPIPAPAGSGARSTSVQAVVF